MIGQAAADRIKCWVIRRLQQEPRTNSLNEGGSVAERVREKSCQCRSEHGKIVCEWKKCSSADNGRMALITCKMGGKPPLYIRNCEECSEGENRSGAERVKGRGQYWVERDKIVRNLLEGTRYR
ncbi:hypothetical protein T4B_6357 [Trichinella pseudospiralis]|uniref:Uncharacterized protein n=1 Tax=Trichinella pseudospiralis TaxID=6337 RepID=A0A0V1GK62_TRIPS|nr:hypothetical protein T4B_6357 [Trichinella pseudospiralis]